MNHNGKAVCIVSYPKSGNTWFRTFLANLISGAAEAVDINQLEIAPIITARQALDQVLGYESGELSHDQIDLIRPELYEFLAKSSERYKYIKIHDGYMYNKAGRPLFPPEATEAVIYIIRNPLDVCVSYAYHSGNSDLDAAIRAMANPNFAMAAGRQRQHGQLRQRLGSWSTHVQGWTKAPGHRVHVIRYEDMLSNPANSFGMAATFLGLTFSSEVLERAINFSEFRTLKKQEEAAGFRERVRADTPFFRKGKVGTYMDALSAAQTSKIVADHEIVMREFGYMTEIDAATNAQ